MNSVKIFLASTLLLCGCGASSEEEVIDLDQMVMAEGEVNRHLAGEPLMTPQETPYEEVDSEDLFSNPKSSLLTDSP